MPDDHKTITVDDLKAGLDAGQTVIGLEVISEDAGEYAAGTDVTEISAAFEKACKEGTEGKTTFLVIKVVPVGGDDEEEPKGGDESGPGHADGEA